MWKYRSTFLGYFYVDENINSRGTTPTNITKLGGSVANAIHAAGFISTM
jgi:hypothetical protein